MDLRSQNIEKLSTEVFDVLIIGSGINGAVSAAALAAHGARVALIDARDFAGFTSQESSNLIWGGIKYMEGYEFGLVSELCKSRNELLRSFPSTVKEIRFLTTINKGFRFHPLLMLAGTWLYWLFGRGKTRIPRLFSAARIKAEEPLVNTLISRGGIEYSDAYLHDNDARFVFNFVRNAIGKGCIATNYVKSLGARRDADGLWRSEVEDQIDNKKFQIRAKVIVNAAGAFVDAHNESTGIATEYQHLFSKGIHLIVPRLSESNRVLAFFADDGRLFFAIPMANRTCIGTTDNRVSDPITGVSDADREFVLSNINNRLNLAEPLTVKDIIAERCGVRPLAIIKGQSSDTDFLQLSRRHIVETSIEQKHISIFGGKLTDCLNIGKEICEQIAELGIHISQPTDKWYGEPSRQVYHDYFKRAQALGLDQDCANDTGEKLSVRLWRRYADAANAMLDAIEQDASLCAPLVENTGVRLCEIDYMVENEFIVKLEDFLRRRSKIELIIARDTLRQSTMLFEVCEKLFGDKAREKFDEYFQQHNPAE